MTLREKPTVALQLMGVPIHDVTMSETVLWVKQWIEEGGAHTIATVNPEFLMAARRNRAFGAALQRAALCLPDGIGVLLAARRKGVRLRERVAGSDMVPLLAHEAARYGWRIFFLGAAPEVAQRTATILAERNPGLEVAGYYAGSPALEEEEDIITRIRNGHADIVFVAGVSRRAPRWIQRIGLEWLYRLAREPWRWRRQLALPQFAALVLLGRD